MQRRVLVSKIGLDGHDWGARYIAQGLRQAGMEVIYLGKYQSVAQVVAAASQEDVDDIIVSFLSGEYRKYAPALLEQLHAEGLEGVRVIVGGLIAPEDEPGLRAMGVAAVFGATSKLEDVLDFLQRSEDDRGAPTDFRQPQ